MARFLPISSSDPSVEGVHQQTVENINHEIRRYTTMRERAENVLKVALIVLATAAVLTGAYYISPILPFTLLILLPFMAIFLIWVDIDTLGQAGHSAAGQAGGNIMAKFAKWCVFSGIHWEKTVYSVQVATIVGLANAAVTGPALVVAGANGGVYYSRLSLKH